MQFFTPTAIGIATIVGFLFGSVWFSPVLFLKGLLIGEGITKSELPKRSKLYILQVHMYSLIAHGVMASVLALMFDLLSISSLKVAISLGALFVFGFIVTKNFLDMVYSLHEEHWKKRLQVKFLVNSGYYIFMVSLMSLVLFLVAK
jgi:hypothetical protein